MIAAQGEQSRVGRWAVIRSDDEAADDGMHRPERGLYRGRGHWARSLPDGKDPDATRAIEIQLVDRPRRRGSRRRRGNGAVIQLQQQLWTDPHRRSDESRANARNPPASALPSRAWQAP